MADRHPFDRGDDTHADRNSTADGRTGVWHDVHNPHDKTDEKGESHHHQRYGQHQQEALGQNPPKVAEQKHCNRIEGMRHVLLVSIREKCRYHRIEKSVVPQEKERDERNRKKGDHARNGQTHHR